MIGLDTNILVRYLVADAPEQSEAAAQVLERECSTEKPGYIAQVVLCELVWVLRGAYGYGKEQIAATLERILTVAELTVEKEEIAWRALMAYRNGPADFADYCILFSSREAGCETVYSFDRKLARSPGVATPGD
ncbi:PIN domain-containing protein [Thiohalorhabdus methylotrophus]|uniref:PIN domain-containing protein n=1 Tax=Thiohalorhabdus methylotrophus TaxID=3242694 RepID=A0ABV4TSY2_9GAMM